jgi:hypothetical protein
MCLVEPSCLQPVNSASAPAPLPLTELAVCDDIISGCNLRVVVARVCVWILTIERAYTVPATLFCQPSKQAHTWAGAVTR